MVWIKYWRQVLLAALAAGVVWYAHHRGFQTALAWQQAVIAEIRAEQRAQALAAEQAYTAKLAEVQKLAQVQQAKADAVAKNLAEQQQKSRLQVERNKKEIDDAIKQDQAAADGCTDGFGAHSLRQYRRALGYAD
ncbi:hypothetical protein LVJ83_09395 [Uruburuella testudinis]|uniref:Uncharacterized protein n=1 Tax=Uruburuella testudinis TaxID=1282863 RepID=A0ABY4DQ49_9NEIS|nr:hypothetical protein [Uruburuella testudinis]UOO81185.1 hypothetical protein LVJ83_09395 [Uruburuella testudinis]